MKNRIKKFALLLLSFSISYADLITVEGDIATDVVWTADNTYYLNNQAFVKDGVTLTIEAGTEILGRYDANYSADNPAPCLVVEQGGKVIAQGTVDAPITFRSELSEDDPNYGNGRGLWGGLIINGRAPIANEGGTAAVEGLTGVLYGGVIQMIILVYFVMFVFGMVDLSLLQIMRLMGLRLRVLVVVPLLNIAK